MWKGSCLIIYNVNLNLICHIFRRFTEHRLNLCSYFFNIPVCYTLLSDNVRGISAIKTVSGDISSFVHYCSDLLPRGNRDSVGVNLVKSVENREDTKCMICGHQELKRTAIENCIGRCSIQGAIWSHLFRN